MSATPSKDFTISSDTTAADSLVELEVQTDLAEALKINNGVLQDIYTELQEQTKILKKIYNPE